MLIVALEGFVDAGSAASTAATFLRHRWLAEPAAVFDPDAFIDYRARRPTVVIDGGHLRRVEWPRLELLAATVAGPRDVLLLVGPEPDMRWQAFGDAVIGLCRELGVSSVLTMGAYPAAAPHTRPMVVVGAANAGASVPEGLSPVPGYTGPIGAATAVEGLLASADVPALGMWAEVPHYLAASPYPPAALALAERAAALVGVDVDVTELQAAATHHLRQVDDAVADHDDAREMISGLERLRDSGGDEEELPTGDDLAAEIETFLRGDPDDAEGGPGL